MAVDFESFEKQQTRAAFLGTLFCFFVHQLYLLVAVVLGWASMHSGPLAELSVASVVPGFLACFFIVHFAIVSPFLHSGSLKAGSPGRWLFAAALWAAPLFSFAYWVGDFKQALHAVDFSYSLVASLSVSLILYWRAKSGWALSFGIAAGVFFPLFVLDDILGPFHPVWVFSTLEPSVYLMRSVSTSFAVLAACFYPIPLVGRAPSSLSERRFLLLLFSLLGSLLCLFQCSSFSTPGALGPDLNWIACLALVFFLRRKDAFGQRAYLGLSVLYAVSLIAQWSILVGASEGAAIDQAKLLYVPLLLGVVASEWAARWRRTAAAYLPNRSLGET